MSLWDYSLFLAQSIALESIAIPGAHVGILPSGEPKLGTATKTGLHGQFYLYRAVSLSVCTKITGHFYTGVLIIIFNKFRT